MSEPEIVQVGGKPLRCHHCGQGTFHPQRVSLGVPVSPPTGWWSGSGTKEAVLLVCAGCGLGQLGFPGVAAKPLVEETTATQERKPIPCRSCGGRIPAGEMRCPECLWVH